LWHFAAVGDVCSNVAYWRTSGPVMLTLSSSAVDPIRTFWGYFAVLHNPPAAVVG